MADKRTVPEIRFKGFEGEWEEKRLGDVMNITSVKRIHQTDWTEAGIRFLRARDIVSASLNEKPTDCLYISEALYNEYSSLSGKVKKNDLLVTGVGSIGVPMLIASDDPLYFKDGNIIWFQNSNSINGNFFYYSFISPGIQNFINISAGIGTVGTYTIECGKITPITLPDSFEQSQIGTFFQNLDSLITMHQRKYEKLTTVKKAMLEKMFLKDGADAPEIRFKGFTKKWEQRTLGEIVTDIRRPIELKDELEYELVTVKRRNEGVVSRGKLKGKDILVKNYFELRSGDYVISKRQIVHGANGVVPPSLDKTIVSNEYLVAVSNDRISTDFFALFSKLPGMYKKFFLSSYGIDIEKLVFDVEDWKKRTVVVPCPSEQQLISSFFQNIDSLITLQQRELDKLKNIKKACLGKMFV